MLKKWFSQAELKSIIQNTGWVSLRYAVVSATGLILSIAFARLSEKTVFAQYQYILAVFSMFTIFSLPGLNIVALKGIVEGKEAILKKTVWKSFHMSWIAVPLMLLYGWFLGSFHGSTFGLAFSLAALLLPFFSAPNTWYAIYEGKLKFKPVAWRIILQNLTITTLLLLAIYFKQNVIWLIVIYILGTAAFNWVYYLHSTSHLPKDQEEPILDMRYGLAVTAQKFIISLADTLPTIIIPFFFGMEMLAVFQIAFLFFTAVAGFLAGVSATYLPKLFHFQPHSFKEKVFENIFIGMLCFLAFRLLIEGVFIFLYGEQYRESFEVAKWFSWLVLFLPLRIFLMNYFTVKKEITLILFTYIIANVGAVGLLWITRNLPFSSTAGAYIAVLQVLLFLPLLLAYFRIASKKTSSI